MNLIIDFIEKILINSHGSLESAQYENKDIEINARCPICGDSNRDRKKARFYYNKEKDNYYCHNCGAKGYISFLIYKFPNIVNVDYGILNKYVNNKIVHDFINNDYNNIIDKYEDEEIKNVEFPNGSLMSYLIEDNNWKFLEKKEKIRFLEVLSYLNGRKINRSWYNYFYFTFDDSKFNNYVLTLTKVVDQFVWSARKVNDSPGPKYLHLKDIKWSKLLGFSNEISRFKGNDLYVVEGWFDALILNIEGYNAISVFGLQNLKFDHNPLDKYRDKYNLIWIPDNDNSLNDFIKINKEFRNNMIVKLIPYKDINEMKEKNETGFKLEFDSIQSINLISLEIKNKLLLL